MKRPNVCFCPGCGSEKVSWEQFRLRCSKCGGLYEIKELETLRMAPILEH